MEFLVLGGTDFPKEIVSTMLYPTPLSDAQAIQLTTL